jgi:hypothetical protein
VPLQSETTLTAGYRLIGRHVGLSKNMVGAILQRARAVNQRKQV